MFPCHNCGSATDSEKVFIADEGFLCPSCCDNLYSNALKKTSHRHDWKTYDSGWNKYYYCECGEDKKHKEEEVE